MKASSEKREFYRVKKAISVRCCKVKKVDACKYAKSSGFSAEAVDFGGNGLLLKVDESFSAGEYLLIEISLPAEKRPVRALGQVMRFIKKEENGFAKYYLGVKFAVIDEGERDKLMKTVLSESVKEKKPDSR